MAGYSISRIAYNGGVQKPTNGTPKFTPVAAAKDTTAAKTKEMTKDLKDQKLKSVFAQTTRRRVVKTILKVEEQEGATESQHETTSNEGELQDGETSSEKETIEAVENRQAVKKMKEMEKAAKEEAEVMKAQIQKDSLAREKKNKVELPKIKELWGGPIDGFLDSGFWPRKQSLYLEAKHAIADRDAEGKYLPLDNVLGMIQGENLPVEQWPTDLVKEFHNLASLTKNQGKAALDVVHGFVRRRVNQNQKSPLMALPEYQAGDVRAAIQHGGKHGFNTYGPNGSQANFTLPDNGTVSHNDIPMPKLNKDGRASRRKNPQAPPLKTKKRAPATKKRVPATKKSGGKQK